MPPPVLVERSWPPIWTAAGAADHEIPATDAEVAGDVGGEVGEGGGAESGVVRGDALDREQVGVERSAAATEQRVVGIVRTIADEDIEGGWIAGNGDGLRRGRVRDDGVGFGNPGLAGPVGVAGIPQAGAGAVVPGEDGGGGHLQAAGAGEVGRVGGGAVDAGRQGHAIDDQRADGVAAGEGQVDLGAGVQGDGRGISEARLGEAQHAFLDEVVSGMSGGGSQFKRARAGLGVEPVAEQGPRVGNGAGGHAEDDRRIVGEAGHIHAGDGGGPFEDHRALADGHAAEVVRAGELQRAGAGFVGVAPREPIEMPELAGDQQVHVFAGFADVEGMGGIAAAADVRGNQRCRSAADGEAAAEGVVAEADAAGVGGGERRAVQRERAEVEGFPGIAGIGERGSGLECGGGGRIVGEGVAEFQVARADDDRAVVADARAVDGDVAVEGGGLAVEVEGQHVWHRLAFDGTRWPRRDRR